MTVNRLVSHVMEKHTLWRIQNCFQFNQFINILLLSYISGKFDSVDEEKYGQICTCYLNLTFSILSVLSAIKFCETLVLKRYSLASTLNRPLPRTESQRFPPKRRNKHYTIIRQNPKDYHVSKIWRKNLIIYNILCCL